MHLSMMFYFNSYMCQTCSLSKWHNLYVKHKHARDEGIKALKEDFKIERMKVIVRDWKSKKKEKERQEERERNRVE
jgi:hypothetical protein